MKYVCIICAALSICTGARADILLPLDVTGWNQDIVIEKTATVPHSNYATTTLDGNTYYYESGLPNGTKGLPQNGSIIASSINTQFQLQPYNQNNALFIADSSPRTLTLTTPAALSQVAILASSAGAPGTANGLVAIHWSNSGTSTYNYAANDWFSPDVSTATGSYGRTDSSNFQDGPNSGELFYTQLDLSTDANYLNGASIVDLSFTRGTGAYTAFSTSILGVSGVASVPVPKTLWLSILPLLIVGTRRRVRHDRAFAVK